MNERAITATNLAILTGLVILVIAGGYFVYFLYFSKENSNNYSPHTLQPESGTRLSVQNSSPAGTGPGFTDASGIGCDTQDSASARIPVPVDTSIPVSNPVPGIRYSLNTSDNDRTIILEKGDMFEINLRFAPGLAMRWTVPISGCGIELMNDGIYSDGGDFWNVTDYYRARYRAVNPGTSILHGKLVLTPGEEPAGGPRFNLTVIVK